MTVDELRAALDHLPDDAEVCLESHNDGVIVYDPVECVTGADEASGASRVLIGHREY
jgi:hypothetical protein